MFSVKDSMWQSLCSRVVYKQYKSTFNGCYTGKTTRHICTRRLRAPCVRQGFTCTFNYKHLQPLGNQSWLMLCRSFGILASAASSFQVEKKEVLYIKCEIQTLSQQLRHKKEKLHIPFSIWSPITIMYVIVAPNINNTSKICVAK